MSYEINITRSEHWADGNKKITRQEWQRILEGDPELKPYGDSCDGDPDPVYRLEIAGLDNAFYYRESTETTVVTRGYCEEILWKVLEIAQKLGAVAQGEEGEFYRLTEHGRETTYERPRMGDQSGEIIPDPATRSGSRAVGWVETQR